MRRNPLYRHPAMRLLQRAIRRELRLQFAASLGLFFLGFYIVYNCYHSNMVLMVMGLSISLIATKLLQYTISNLRKGSNRLLNILQNQPGQVVWIYSVVIERMPFGILLMRAGTMFFKMADGTEMSVRLPGNHLRTVSRFLARLLPHATFGYTSDRDYSFRLSPENLRRDWTDQFN
ncbi:MAG: hypothetical protein IPN74_17065 [Haliscomenobacter sp.]|nr:hypothetical protein [Haliscomenobacter sp.]